MAKVVLLFLFCFIAINIILVEVAQGRINNLFTYTMIASRLDKTEFEKAMASEDARWQGKTNLEKPQSSLFVRLVKSPINMFNTCRVFLSKKPAADYFYGTTLLQLAILNGSKK